MNYKHICLNFFISLKNSILVKIGTHNDAHCTSPSYCNNEFHGFIVTVKAIKEGFYRKIFGLYEPTVNRNLAKFSGNICGIHVCKGINLFADIL